jgi:D-glycero-D-manno-heptose 1,7-bisphosphate phosphatase
MCPKPLVQINGIPFLAYLISDLASSGVNNIYLLGGYLADEVESFARVYREVSHVRITCIKTPEEWSTTRRLFDAMDKLDGDTIALYGDVRAQCAINLYYSFFKHLPSSHTASLAGIHRTGLGGNILLQKDGFIYGIHQRANSFMDCAIEGIFTDLGYIGFNPSSLNTDDFDIDRSFQFNIYRRGSRHHGIYTDLWPYYTLTDVNTLETTQKAMNRSGVNLIMDRDGVIIESLSKGQFVSNRLQIRFNDQLLDFIADNAHSINEVQIITNQPGLQQKMISHSEYKDITRCISEHISRMTSLDVQVHTCPHTPEQRCTCRKPSPTLLLNQIHRRLWRREKTIMLGDSGVDRSTATSLNCKYVHVEEGNMVRSLDEFGFAIDQAACIDYWSHRFCRLTHGRPYN